MKSVNLNISFVFLMLLLFCLPNRAQPHESHSFRKIELPTFGSEDYAFDSHSNGPYTGLNDGRIVKYAGHKTGFVDFATTAPNRAQAHISHSFRKIKLPSLGSEAYAFDSHNNGPYTGLNDGRVVKYEGHKNGFVDFATTAPNRSKELCDGNNGDNPKTCQLCGRPIGLEFNHKTGELYIVDAIRGLMVVGSGGGVAERLAGGIDGAPFNAPDAIGIDPVTGDVYFTDIGTIFFKTR